MEEFVYLINEFAAGWKLVGNEVIRVNKFNMRFSEVQFRTTQMHLIMSTTKESGSIMMALTEYLIGIHNSFIREQKRYSTLPEWGK